MSQFIKARYTAAYGFLMPNDNEKNQILSFLLNFVWLLQMYVTLYNVSMRRPFTVTENLFLSMNQGTNKFWIKMFSLWFIEI